MVLFTVCFFLPLPANDDGFQVKLKVWLCKCVSVLFHSVSKFSRYKYSIVYSPTIYRLVSEETSTHQLDY